MSRPSAKKHVIADIRLKCGLTQPQLAKLLGVAGISLQRVEQGTLRMSEEMAAKAEKQLDVSGAYLLANDPTQAPVTPRGGLWNVEHYEFSQGSISHVKEVKPSGKKALRYRSGPHGLEGTEDEFQNWKLLSYVGRIHAMLEGTKGTPRQGILVHRLNKVIEELVETFKPDEATLSKYLSKIKKARDAYDAIAERISKEEHDKIWREEQEG